MRIYSNCKDYLNLPLGGYGKGDWFWYAKPPFEGSPVLIIKPENVLEHNDKTITICELLEGSVRINGKKIKFCYFLKSGDWTEVKW